MSKKNRLKTVKSFEIESESNNLKYADFQTIDDKFNEFTKES